MDFSVYPGVHVFPDCGDCVEWCAVNRMRWKGETAIQIFRLPKSILSSDGTKCLEGEEWSRVTKRARQSTGEDELDDVWDCDFVYGNQVSNADAVVIGTEAPCPHNPPRRQLVGVSDVAEKILHNGLVGCLYFQKERV